MPLYSWPTHRDPLELTIIRTTVDGDVRDELMHPAHRHIRLDEAAPWSTVTLTATVTIPVDPDVPPAESVHLLVASPRTHTRLPVRLHVDGSGWAGSTEIPRGVLAGSVTVVAEATAPVDSRTRLLGRSEEWRLIVDPGEAPVAPGFPPFPMSWIDFSAPDAPEPARRNPRAHAVMDLTASPTLLLNDGIEGFRALLHAETARGERRRARDLLGAEVARTAITGILRIAVDDVAADDDGAAPADPLQRQVLDAVARTLRATGDLDELCTRIAGAQDGPPSERAGLWADLEGAVATLCGYPDALASVAAEARNA